MKNPHLEPDDRLLPPEERQIDKTLRPQELDDFSGQDKIVDNLRVFIQAARMRDESLDHVLLHGVRLCEPAFAQSLLVVPEADQQSQYHRTTDQSQN